MLDIGSGVGDVAILAARLVGPSGEVVGIERDPRSLARARARVAAAGFRNVTFTQADISQLPPLQSFDAAVGRFVLMFLPDPVAALRAVTALVRQGGVIAFQEPYWAPVRAHVAPLPLWSAAVALLCDAFERAGARPEMGAALHARFLEAGLPAPTMRFEMPLGRDPDFAQFFAVTLSSLRPEIERAGLRTALVGSFDTLAERLQAEVDASRHLATWLPSVGAWSRKLAG